MGMGMVVSFAFLGLLLGAVGPATGLNSDHVRMLGAVLLMSLGVLIWVPALNERFTQWMTPVASAANALSERLHGDTFWGALLLGAVLGLVWSPCSGPLLASALIMAASEGGAWQGTVVLGFFGLGAATPLVAAAYASRHFFATVQHRVQAHGEQAKKIVGALTFLTGLAIATGADKRLEALVLTLLPVQWLQVISRF
jgi:cytochrome c biogenesis protein CcdA